MKIVSDNRIVLYRICTAVGYSCADKSASDGVERGSGIESERRRRRRRQERSRRRKEEELKKQKITIEPKHNFYEDNVDNLEGQEAKHRKKDRDEKEKEKEEVGTQLSLVNEQ